MYLDEFCAPADEEVVDVDDVDVAEVGWASCWSGDMSGCEQLDAADDTDAADEVEAADEPLCWLW